MTPELSRDLAHIKNKYASRDDADTNLISEFMRYIREHEDDINELSDIPDKFFAILFNVSSSPRTYYAPRSNPYAIVREEQRNEDNGDIHTVYTKSYDAQDRVVGVSTTHYRNGEEISHFAEYVEADGCWHGGFYDRESDNGGQTCRPFIEGEVQ